MCDRAGLRNAPFRQGLLRCAADPGCRIGKSRRFVDLRIRSNWIRLSVYFSLRMVLPENRFPPRIKCGAGFFGIMPQLDFDLSIAVVNGTSMMPWLSSALVQ